MPSHIDEIPPPEYQSSIIQDIHDIMSTTPNAIALTDGDLEWSYADLHRQSDLVARNLASHKIKHGSVIGMHLPRCADAIAVMLGIMMSGCVYLPLDPSYPRGRLQYMLDRAGAIGVISNGSDPELYGSHRIWLPAPSRLTSDLEELARKSVTYHAGKLPIEPQDCAYILFTSGSTGEPKGVMVTHKNITLMSKWSAKFLGISSVDSSATTCSLSFDASFHETLLPLSLGGTVHVIPHALALGRLSRPVSFVATTPTVADELLRAGELPPLKVLMLGGEALSPNTAARLLTSGRVGMLLNCYGPTECTVCVTVGEVTIPVPDTIPIGLSAPGTDVLILDDSGRPVPNGKPGEICIFGEQVTQGYVNDPAETAAHFVDDLGIFAQPRRYYRTGDLGYHTDDGVIYFIGRADRQVKLNGIRVELGEIDMTLQSHPRISEAITVVRDNDRMISYVVPIKADLNIDPADVRRYLTESLPSFMRPIGIVVLPKLPKTVNGKLDASALPEWSPRAPENELDPANDFDQFTTCVIRIAANVTGFVGQISPADDFIDDLGGSSLDVVRVLVELERYSHRKLRISDALADTSIAGLACLLRGRAVHTPADFAFNTDGDGPPLFLIHTYLGGMLGLRHLAELLPKNRPVYGLHVYQNTENPNDEITIASLAQSAVNRMREIQPAGRITMAGHSAGGLIVFEAARIMLASGNLEPTVMLMDTPRPHNAYGYHLGELVLHWREHISDPVGKLRKVALILWRATRPRKTHPKITTQPDDLLTLTESNSKSVSLAIKHWKAQAYFGNITLMRTRQGRLMALGRRRLGWTSVTRGALRIIDVPGNHLSMLETPHLHTVAEVLADWLARSQAVERSEVIDR